MPLILLFVCVCFVTQGQEYKGDIFRVVEEMPRMYGCEHIEDKEALEECAQKTLMDFVYDNMEYPYEAEREGVEGMSVVQFTVEVDGNISDISVVRSLRYGIDEEAEYIVSLMQDQETKYWRPGYEDGEAVRVRFTLPIKFKLDQ